MILSSLISLPNLWENQGRNECGYESCVLVPISLLNRRILCRCRGLRRGIMLGLRLGLVGLRILRFLLCGLGLRGSLFSCLSRLVRIVSCRYSIPLLGCLLSEQLYIPSWLWDTEWPHLMQHTHWNPYLNLIQLHHVLESKITLWIVFNHGVISSCIISSSIKLYV